MLRFLRIGAWLGLLLILIVTLSPIQFRPGIAGSPNIERFTAFFFVAIAFSLAYPRRWLTVIVLTIGSAAALELLQRLAPGRHGELPDFLIKSTGAIIGVLAARCLHALGLFRNK